MSRRRRTLVPRDQAVSSFSATLLRLCDTSGAVGATLVDPQGETVDYAGYVEPYALKVMAAEWRIVLDCLHRVKKLGFDETQEFVVRSQRKSYALVALAEGYALVFELPRRAFSFSRRAVAEAVRELEVEAGLSASNPMRQSERWSKLEVRTAPDNPWRPEAIWFQGAWQPVTIVGRYATPDAGRHLRRRPPSGASGSGTGATEGGGAGGAAAPPTQKGRGPSAPPPPRGSAYRARLATGQEFALVREPMGFWFGDDLTGFEPVPR